MTTGVERLDWTLQHYSIGQLIASGHFGVVYQARHVPLGRDVALKLIPLQGQDSDEKVAAERHGAVLQQRFGEAHPDLVPAVFEHQPLVPFYAIAMELVRGRQLTSLIAEGPVPPRHAAQIGLAVAVFLTRAHQFETDIEGQRYALIVHADLKPDHVLLLDDGSIRVLDFGIAKALATRTLVTTNKWGSVQYASPERLQSDGHVNAHVDFWSLGIMLFEMVAGFRPYRRYEHNASLLDSAIRRQEARESLPSGADPTLAAIIAKLLSPQIERRYASAEAIAQDLNEFLRGHPTVAEREHAQAGQETSRIAPTATTPRRPDSIPTEPLPVRRAEVSVATASPPTSPPTSPATSSPVLSPPPQPSTARRPPPWRTVKIVALLVGLATATSEGLALVRAGQLRGEIPALDISDLPRVKSEYERIDAWTPLGLGSALVGGALTSRMVALADRTILEFRTDAPAVAKAQWEQASQCLDFATAISPSNTTVAGKRAYVRGQLARIAERYDEAIRSFRDAGRLIPREPDPHLGLAMVFAYVTYDLDGFTQAIEDARRLGYKPGRRVRIWSGDLHLKLGERAQAEAKKLAGTERLEQLTRAANDYQQCVDDFDGIRLFNSESNLRTCRRRLAEIVKELPPPPSPTSVTPDESRQGGI